MLRPPEGWGPVAKQFWEWLDANPKLKHLRVKALAYLMNRVAPQSQAHGRTIVGGCPCVIGDIENTYMPTIELIKEINKLKEQVAAK